MSNTTRWVLVIVALVLVVGLIAFARGDEERGADTTTTVSTDEGVTTAPLDEVVTTTTSS
jgi:hypothetical protein